MMIGSRLLPLVAGPVNIWNATSHTPPAADLAGYYRLSSETARIPIDLAPSTRLRSGFRLGADHSLEVTGLPDFDGLGKPTNCSYDGTGTWSTWDGGDGVRLTLNLDVSTPPRRGEPPRCAPVSLGLFHVLGHRPAYRFWYNVGDPDNAMGLLYVREGR